jgi:hypothetical protein
VELVGFEPKQTLITLLRERLIPWQSQLEAQVTVVIPERVPVVVVEESILLEPPRAVVEEVRPVVRLRASLVVAVAEAVEVIFRLEPQVVLRLVAPEMVMLGGILRIDSLVLMWLRRAAAEAQVQQEETAPPAMSLVTAEMGWPTTIEPVRMSPMRAEVGVVRPTASPPVAVVLVAAETVPVREPGDTVLLTLEAAEEDVGMMLPEVLLEATVDRESRWFGTREPNGLWVVL